LRGAVTLRTVSRGGANMPRKMVDCRETPSVSNCTLKISGEEDEVVRAAALHAHDVHGHEDTPQLREEIRRSLKDESPRST
jgi:predicted small metal-binding protein